MNRRVDSATGYKPPDAGWAWMVFLAFALNNLLVLPLVSGFGLIFQETFPQYGISAMATSVIITMHQASGMAFSIFNRRLVRTYGPRKMANCGGILIFLGIILTSQTKSVVSFIVAYSVMTSVGLSLVMSSFCYGVHSYFDLKREKAIQYGMMLTGVGSAMMPQLINHLMYMYSTKWTIAILGAISLNAFVAAMILRPIKWYNKPTIAAAEPLIATNRNEPETSIANESVEQSSPNVDTTNTVTVSYKSNSHTETNEDGTLKATWFKWWKSDTIEVNLSSSLNIFNENETPATEVANDAEPSIVARDTVDCESNDPKRVDTMTFKYQLYKVFNEGYFKDYTFSNVILGMTIEEVAEVNFTLLTPFMLRDLAMETWQIANVLSVISASDLVYRFASRFIGEWCHKSARVMYMMSLCMLIFTRTTFYFASAYESMLIVGVGLGIAKGVRTVYKYQVIPKFIKTEKKITIATNITMITYSLALILSGPIFGQIRDDYYSYNIPIILINILTGIAIILWTVEYIIVKILSKASTDHNT